MDTHQRISGLSERSFPKDACVWNCFNFLLYVSRVLYSSRDSPIIQCLCLFPFIIPPHNEVVGGILVSLRRLSVRPSVCPASRVCSVASTVLVGSISYLHILSSNFRRCVACKVACKIWKFEFLAIFLNLLFWLCLILTRELIWITSMGNHGASGGISEHRHSSCSSCSNFMCPSMWNWKKWIILCALWDLNAIKD